MKKMCGVLLLCLQKMAKKVVKNPECQHADKIRDDQEFYEGYLLPKFQKYCDDKGWVLPAVSAFEYGRKMSGDDEYSVEDGVLGGGGIEGGAFF